MLELHPDQFNPRPEGWGFDPYSIARLSPFTSGHPAQHSLNDEACLWRLPDGELCYSTMLASIEVMESHSHSMTEAVMNLRLAGEITYPVFCYLCSRICIFEDPSTTGPDKQAVRKQYPALHQSWSAIDEAFNEAYQSGTAPILDHNERAVANAHHVFQFAAYLSQTVKPHTIKGLDNALALVLEGFREVCGHVERERNAMMNALIGEGK